MGDVALCREVCREELEEKGRVMVGGSRGAGPLPLPLGDGGGWGKALVGREVGVVVKRERLTRRELGDRGVGAGSGSGSGGRGLRG